MTQSTIRGLTDKQGVRLAELLQKQLSTYNDLHLTLKHIHWNVLGPNFIGVHEMIDRRWSVGRDTVAAHLAALDLVYNGVIEDIRGAIDETDELDPVTQDLLIGQAGHLEKFQWFVRAHLESAGGKLAHAGSTTEESAARRARRKS